MKKLYGVVVPIVTPLTQEDAIDVTSLKRLADHCIDSGMQAIYPCGTTGEMMYLSVEERRLVAETVVRHAAGRVPVFVHVGAWNLRDTVELAKHAAEIGAHLPFSPSGIRGWLIILQLLQKASRRISRFTCMRSRSVR